MTVEGGGGENAGRREAAAVASRFALAGPVRTVEPHPGGYIHSSFRVDTAAGAYLLQRLNRTVFPEPTRVMENVARVSAHLARRLTTTGTREPARHALTLVPTTHGASWLDAGGEIWRCYVFVTGAHCRVRADTPLQAYRAAGAFGEFLGLLADLDGPPLHGTIPRFHDTAHRFAVLDGVLRSDPMRRAAGAGAEVAAVLSHRQLADVLPPLVASGAVPRRVVHNDAKIANVLFDDGTGEALCVTDLDTVMPGTALYDVGDLVRSMASPTDEDETDLSRVVARPEVVAATLTGYQDGAGPALTPRERELLGFAGRLITLEQAVRFLTDHLAGDRYYPVTREGHNLDRARAQIKLLDSLIALEQAS